MLHTYILKGKLINPQTIHLEEPFYAEFKKVKVIIEPEAEVKDDQAFVFGCLKGKITMSDDFNKPINDFKEYMQ